MVKVLGCWELGWSTPIMEFDLWHFPLRDFEVDELIMTPISGISQKVTEYATIEDAINANKNLTPVFLDEDGEVELDVFIHPVDVLYIFGKASYSPFSARAKQGQSVKIETAQGKGMLWPHQAASIVLRDRHMKWR